MAVGTALSSEHSLLPLASLIPSLGQFVLSTSELTFHPLFTPDSLLQPDCSFLTA